MISVCTVTLDCLEPVEELFLDSIATKTKVVSEVVLANNDKEKGYYKETKVNGIPVRKFGTGIRETSSYGHALGLHACLDRARNDHVLLCDADVFFYRPVDEIFLKLMTDHALFAVGTSINCPPILAQTFFPFVHCLLLRKSLLPGPDFLSNCHRVENLHSEALCLEGVPLNGKYLLPGPTREYWQSFPNPAGSFDTSCNLWLWCQQHNYKWLSFQTMDRHNYNLTVYRTNFKLKEKFANEKLLYHIISATHNIMSKPSLADEYRKLWGTIKHEV